MTCFIQHALSNSNNEIDMYKVHMNIKPKTFNNNQNNQNNRLAYVDALVDATALVIESIWQLKKTNTSNNVVPLRIFIQEVLKRSRTTYSTLQTALFYIFRSKPEIEQYLSGIQKNNQYYQDAYVSCGRRMFLASLVVASKFVQDKTYRNSAWAKISGLPVMEVNISEKIFLNLIDYRLYINQITFERWHHVLHKHIESKILQHSTINLTHVLSPALFLSPPSTPMPMIERKRKRNNELPSLTMSLPSSIHSSPIQTPTSQTHWNSPEYNKKRKISIILN